MKLHNFHSLISMHGLLIGTAVYSRKCALQLNWRMERSVVCDWGKSYLHSKDSTQVEPIVYASP